MNYKYNILKNKAYDIAERACIKHLDGNDVIMASLVCGANNSKIGEEDGHNYYAVLDALYDLYKNQPEYKVDEALIAGIKKSLIAFLEPEYVKNTTHLIVEQAKRQKDNKSPFKIPYVDLLSEVNNAIHTDELSDMLNNQRDVEWINRVNDAFKKI